MLQIRLQLGTYLCRYQFLVTGKKKCFCTIKLPLLSAEDRR